MTEDLEPAVKNVEFDKATGEILPSAKKILKEESKTLELAIAQLQKQYGAGSVVRLGSTNIMLLGLVVSRAGA